MNLIDIICAVALVAGLICCWFAFKGDCEIERDEATLKYHISELTGRGRGGLVQVEAPGYSGQGELWSDPHRKTTRLNDDLIVVDVMLGNGNVWEYPVECVTLKEKS